MATPFWAKWPAKTQVQIDQSLELFGSTATSRAIAIQRVVNTLQEHLQAIERRQWNDDPHFSFGMPLLNDKTHVLRIEFGYYAKDYYRGTKREQNNKQSHLVATIDPAHWREFSINVERKSKSSLLSYEAQGQARKVLGEALREFFEGT